MKKEEDHDPFADAVTADADGQGERVGQKSGTGKAGEVNAEGDEDDGDRIPATVDGIAQAVKEIEDNRAGGEFLGKREIG